MATKFLEPGGDADFAVATTNGFWSSTVGTAPTVATDFVHGNHVKSISYAKSANSLVRKLNVFTDAGSRLSLYLYINALPSATANLVQVADSSFNALFTLKLTTAGTLQIIGAAQIGSNGTTLNTGQWYRISMAYTVTSTTVNRIELFVNGLPSISVTSGILGGTGSNSLVLGHTSDANFDIRTSDHYIDDSSALTDTGDIWVVAKRPNANGTTNGFTTQIGAGGSGYGTGHSPQVNERPLSTTNGWSMIGAGSAVTEEYNIESASTGDMDISIAPLIDYLGWVSASAALSETGSIIVDNVTNNISLTSTNTMFTQIAGSTTYPAGTGTDIGIITSTTVTTVSLYECGIILAVTGLAAPSVLTITPTSVTSTTATGNGSVTNSGNQPITERGVCWSTSVNPTTADSKATSAGTTGQYTVSITGLSANTIYHARAYAINAFGTSYGGDIQFDTSSPNTSGTDLLLESGFDLLQENGSRILLETNPVTTTVKKRQDFLTLLGVS